MMAEATKEARLKRRNVKAGLTRSMREVEFYVANGCQKEDVEKSLLTVREFFNNLVTVHEQYTALIEDDEAFEAEEMWLQSCQEAVLSLELRAKCFLLGDEDSRNGIIKECIVNEKTVKDNDEEAYKHEEMEQEKVESGEVSNVSEEKCDDMDLKPEANTWEYKLLYPNLLNFTATKEVYFTDSLDDAWSFVKQHELRHTVRFSGRTSDRNFGQTDFWADKHKVMWKTDVIPFTGVPFFVLSDKYLDCQHGKCRLPKAKQIQRSLAIKRRRGTRDSRKVGCPAGALLKEIMEFPSFKIESYLAWKRKNMSQVLRKAVQSREIPFVCVRRFVVTIDNVSTHRNHVSGQAAGMSQVIDPRLAAKIAEHAHEVKNVMEMQQVLKDYVDGELFEKEHLPDPNNRRFYPTKRIIRQHIFRSRKRLQLEHTFDITIERPYAYIVEVKEEGSEKQSLSVEEQIQGDVHDALQNGPNLSIC